MSIIPNQVSSERSTAQSMDVPGGSTSQGNYEGYDDRSMLGDEGRGGISARDAHIPAHIRKAMMTTGGAIRDYRSYPSSAQASESGINSSRQDGLNTDVSYSSLSGPNPVNLTSQPPPTTVGPRRDTPDNHPPQPPIATLDPSTSTDPSQASRKRRGTYEAAQQLASGVPMSSPTTPMSAGPSGVASQPNKEVAKRTKTSRACDPCRRKKIRQAGRFCSFCSPPWQHVLLVPLLLSSCLLSYRCDVIQNSDPPLCAHCKQYGFDCTFFLPITETRWKKRKLDEEEGAMSSAPAQKTSHSRTVARQDSAPSTTSAFPIRRTSSDTHALNTPTGPQRTDARIYGTILAHGF